MKHTKELNDLLSSVRGFLKDWGAGAFALDGLAGDHANSIMKKMAALNKAGGALNAEEQLKLAVKAFDAAAIQWTRAPHPIPNLERIDKALELAYAASDWLEAREATCRHGKPKEGECAGCIEEGS